MPTSPHTLARQCAPRTVIHLDAHRPVVMVRDPGDEPTTIEAADHARRSYPHPERRLSDIGSGVRLSEHHVPGWAAHAVSEIGQPPSEAPRIPRRPMSDQARGERIGNFVGCFLLGLLLFLLAVAVFGRPDVLAWLRSFF